MIKIKIKQTYGNPNAPDLKLSDRVDLTVSDRATVRPGLMRVKSKQTDARASRVGFRMANNRNGEHYFPTF